MHCYPKIAKGDTTNASHQGEGHVLSGDRCEVTEGQWSEPRFDGQAATTTYRVKAGKQCE